MPLRVKVCAIRNFKPAELGYISFDGEKYSIEPPEDKTLATILATTIIGYGPEGQRVLSLKDGELFIENLQYQYHSSILQCGAPKGKIDGEVAERLQQAKEQAALEAKQVEEENKRLLEEQEAEKARLLVAQREAEEAKAARTKEEEIREAVIPVIEEANDKTTEMLREMRDKFEAMFQQQAEEVRQKDSELKKLHGNIAKIANSVNDDKDDDNDKVESTVKMLAKYIEKQDKKLDKLTDLLSKPKDWQIERDADGNMTGIIQK